MGGRIGAICCGTYLGYMYPQYMCILLYVKLIWCNAVFHTSIVNWSGGVKMYSQYMCILLYVKLIWCSNIPYIYSQLVWGRDRCILSICAFCYMWNLFGVMVFRYIYCQLGLWGVRCILSICAFWYMWNLFGVMVFHISIVNWSVGVDVFSVYVHSAICETYLV